MSSAKLMLKLASKGDALQYVNSFRQFADGNALYLSDSKKRQAIHLASMKGHSKMVNELVKLGAEVNSICSRGNTAIHYACMSSSLSCIILLLQAGADLRAVNANGETPLDVISDHHQTKLGSLLRQAEKKNQLNQLKGLKKVEEMFNNNNMKLHNTNCRYPLKVIEKDVEFDHNKILAKGPNVCFCEGTFHSMPVLLKYVTNSRSERLIFHEMKILRKLRHPNLLLAIGIVTAQAEHARNQIVFELPSYGFLHRVLFQTNLQLQSEDILRIGRGLGCALLYLHEEKFVHCSVTTFSVTLGKNMTAKLCNFSYVQQTDKLLPISHKPSLYPYMAPKQLRGHVADQSNDVYGMGVVIFECVTRRKMQEVNQNLTAHYNEKKELRMKLKLISNQYERAIHVLIEACLSKVDMRPTSQQVVDWLEALLEGRLATISPTTMAKEDLEKLVMNHDT